MVRPILFQIHWFLGITAGFVLAVMGVTGATISFEKEIQRALSPGIVTLTGTGTALSPQTVIERAMAQRPGLRVNALVVQSDPTLAWQVQFAGKSGPKGKGGRGERLYVDPRDGRVLGHPHGEDFFRTVEDLHRWLALPQGPNGIGRQITGFAALSLVFFALSGLYLRWPKRPLDWRAWFVLDLRMTGRNLYRTLHAVIGGWVLLFYLLSASTGLWWSYDWYRQGVLHLLTGKEVTAQEARGGKDANNPPVSIETAWQSYVALEGQRFATVSIMPPQGEGPVRFRSLPRGARHDRMVDDYRIAVDGKVVDADIYDQRPLGEIVTTSVLELHRGAFFGLPGRIVMLITSLTMPLFTVTGLLLYLGRRRKKRQAVPVPMAATMPVPQDGDLLVAYASQTGGAEFLAVQTAAAFGSPLLMPLAAVDDAVLARVRRALFVVSTYGEGEAPDSARRFARKAMATPPVAQGLDYAVLALGDRQYPDFCAFGHDLDRWLHAGGGKRLFDIVEMDGEDADAERHWQQQLAAIGAADQPDWAPAAYERWRLAERRLLNPGSVGGSVFLIALEPGEGAAQDWQAGDIVDVAPRHGADAVVAFLAQAGADGAQDIDGRTLRDRLAESVFPAQVTGDWMHHLTPLGHREYSIASVPQDGRLELVVRQHVAPDGTLGLGSGWLTAHAAKGGDIQVRLKANAGFRAPDGVVPMILIGNGTGIAGLRAHLRQAQRRGSKGHWLLFGERHAEHDALFADELAAWLADGTLARLDRAFSRDAGDGRYVQDLLADATGEIAAMVAQGAVLFVCGSLKGMAPAVDQALRGALGDAVLEAMAEDGRYRRDIY